MKFKVSYVYEIDAPSKSEARLLMAKARETGQDEELFSYVSIRSQEGPGLRDQLGKLSPMELAKQAIGQLVG